MSCHSIGRGMNSVVRTTVSLMDENRISKEAYISTGEYEDHNNGCRWVDYNLA